MTKNKESAYIIMREISKILNVGEDNVIDALKKINKEVEDMEKS